MSCDMAGRKRRAIAQVSDAPKAGVCFGIPKGGPWLCHSQFQDHSPLVLCVEPATFIEPLRLKAFARQQHD